VPIKIPPPHLETTPTRLVLKSTTIIVVVSPNNVVLAVICKNELGHLIFAHSSILLPIALIGEFMAALLAVNLANDHKLKFVVFESDSKVLTDAILDSCVIPWSNGTNVLAHNSSLGSLL
jgi:hypothetical protein